MKGQRLGAGTEPAWGGTIAPYGLHSELGLERGTEAKADLLSSISFFDFTLETRKSQEKPEA